MPRVDAYKEKYLINDFRKMVKKKMYGEYTQEELGDEFGMSQSGISYKIKHGGFDLREIVHLFNFLGFTNEEILKVMGR